MNNFNKKGVCEIANDNSDGQVVISGNKEDVDSFKLLAKNEGAKLTVDLNVSAPFHCKLMKNAAEKMKSAISEVLYNKYTIPLISNVEATPCKKISDFKILLSNQITNTVKWRETIMFMEKKGVNRIYEIGPGNVLSGLVKRIAKGIECFSIQNPEDMDNLE